MQAKPDLFGFQRPRAPRRFMAHMVDVGISDCVPQDSNMTQIAEFKCNRCGWESGWIYMKNVTAVKHGVPCDECNGSSENA
ncbi:hypothetical protein BJI49_09745 [Acetobacter pasteurianus]|nr:hypothetical protein BJI49_09745 [Acetobacter pasteurianus]GCD50134.1 hypothetical protein NBRC106471_1690 [Acetobacter pasteurianus subsp. pasteurianus LMG 1262 = NBRC 106471]